MRAYGRLGPGPRRRTGNPGPGKGARTRTPGRRSRSRAPRRATGNQTQQGVPGPGPQEGGPRPREHGDPGPREHESPGPRERWGPGSHGRWLWLGQRLWLRCCLLLREPPMPLAAKRNCLRRSISPFDKLKLPHSLTECNHPFKNSGKSTYLLGKPNYEI